jgi:hypothetical protein
VSRSVRVLASLASLAVVLAAAPAVLAAGPTVEILDLNDPQADIDESASISDACGFPIAADVAGTWRFVVYPEDARHVVEIDHYVTRVTYTNLDTGRVVKLRDIGPDRAYLRDGHLYVAVTGRAVTSQGNIGQVVVDIETGEIVFRAGNDVGLFNDQLCDALAA